MQKELSFFFSKLFVHDVSKENLICSLVGSGIMKLFKKTISALNFCNGAESADLRFQAGQPSAFVHELQQD